MEDDCSTSPNPEASARVRTLLRSGDNILKNRAEASRIDAARARYQSARAIAVEANLGPDILTFIERRIAEVGTSVA